MPRNWNCSGDASFVRDASRRVVQHQVLVLVCGLGLGRAKKQTVHAARRTIAGEWRSDTAAGDAWLQYSPQDSVVRVPQLIVLTCTRNVTIR